MNSYELSRSFIDFSFENPSKIKPNHYAVFFFAIEHCNRLGWKSEFGLPTSMTMEATGIRSYNTYIKTFTELNDFGFINIIEKSKNQYSSNIIALSNFDKALDKALDKAFIKHSTKHSTKHIPKQHESTVQSTVQSISSINKQITNNQLNNKQDKMDDLFLKKVCNYFSQTTEDLEMKVWSVLNHLNNKNKLGDFKKQTLAYIDYKKISNEKIHSWNGYHAEWNTSDWEDKLKKIKNNSKEMATFQTNR
jgi:uncharacterized protein YlbG (UPF0298 family)